MSDKWNVATNVSVISRGDEWEAGGRVFSFELNPCLTSHTGAFGSRSQALPLPFPLRRAARWRGVTLRPSLRWERHRGKITSGLKKTRGRCAHIEQFVTMRSKAWLSRVSAQFIRLKASNLLMPLGTGPKNLYPFEASGALQAHLSKPSCFKLSRWQEEEEA